MAEVFSDRRTLSRWDLATPPLSPRTQTVQMLLESSFLFMHATGDEEAAQQGTATAGEGGVTRTVIKSLRGGRGGRQRVFAASSLGSAAREQYAATQAGGGTVEAPPTKGAAQRPASRRPPRQKIGRDDCDKKDQ